jgi:hypothetical protein
MRDMSDMPERIPAMIRVRDTARSARFYRAAVRLDTADRPSFETFTPIDLAHAASGLASALTVNTGHDGACGLGVGAAPGTARSCFIDDPDEHKIEVLARGWRFA